MKKKRKRKRMNTTYIPRKRRKIKNIDELSILKTAARNQLLKNRFSDDPIGSLLHKAVEKHYPYAEQIQSFHYIFKTASALLSNTTNTICHHCALWNPESPTHNCNIVNIKHLHISFKEIQRKGYLSDVYVCLDHRMPMFHVCRARFCYPYKTESGSVCPITRKQISQNYQSETYQNVTTNGKTQSTYISRKWVRVGAYSTKTVYTTDKNVKINVNDITILLNELHRPNLYLQHIKTNLLKCINYYNLLFKKKVTQCIQLHQKPIKVKPAVKIVSLKKKVKKKRILKRRKAPRRRKKHLPAGSLNLPANQKLIHWIDGTKTDKTFVNQRRRFERFLTLVRASRHDICIPYNSLISCVEQTTQHHLISDDAMRVDPTNLSWYFPGNETVLYTEFKDPLILYFYFLNLPDIKRVIKRDKHCELILRNKDHPMLRADTTVQKEFLKGLGRKVHFIKRLTPGLFRLYMMFNDIKKQATEKIATARGIIKNLHNKEYMPNVEDLIAYAPGYNYDYKKYYLHETISDELVIEIAEVMHWAEKMCEKHPYYVLYNATEMTEEIVYIGCLFLLQEGLHYNEQTILPKHPILSQREYLVPPNRLNMVLTNRKNVGTGVKLLKNTLTNLCNIFPIHEIAFLQWKMKNKILVVPEHININTPVLH